MFIMTASFCGYNLNIEGQSRNSVTFFPLPENQTQRLPPDPKYTYISVSKSNAVANTSKSVAHFPFLSIPVLFTQSFTLL